MGGLGSPPVLMLVASVATCNQRRRRCAPRERRNLNILYCRISVLSPAESSSFPWLSNLRPLYFSLKVKDVTGNTGHCDRKRDRRGNRPGSRPICHSATPAPWLPIYLIEMVTGRRLANSERC